MIVSVRQLLFIHQI